MYIKDCRNIISNLKKGNTIKCKDGKDMLDFDSEIHKLGYKTVYLYSWEGESGYYIQIVGEPGEKNERT